MDDVGAMEHLNMCCCHIIRTLILVLKQPKKEKFPNQQMWKWALVKLLGGWHFTTVQLFHNEMSVKAAVMSQTLTKID